MGSDGGGQEGWADVQWANSLLPICAPRPGALESAMPVAQSRLPIGHCVPLGGILHLSECQASYLKKVRSPGAAGS